jgi:peroxin-5
MSFLNSGPECSTGANPLAQFSKHVQDDNSLQRDRLVGPGAGLQEGMRTQQVGPGQDAVSIILSSA